LEAEEGEMPPDTPLSPAIAEIVNIFAWQGKTFDAASDTLVNQITFFGISAIEAKILVAPSQFDGNDCIVLPWRSPKSGHL